VTVTGKVLEINDTAFSIAKAIPYTMNVNVSAQSPTPGQPTTTTLYDGSSPFHLDGVTPGLVWLRTQPSATDVLGAWFLVSADPTTQVGLPVVLLETINTVAGTLPTPQTISDTAAHLVLSLLDGSNAPLVGATVSADFSAVIGYDDGPGYTGVATGQRGMVVFLNATAAGTGSVQITTKDGKTATVPNLPLDAKLVTLSQVTVQ
jgi:hypothetical protein